MRKASVVLGLLALLACTAFAQQGPVPTGIPQLNHVFVIMIENHGYAQIVSNPNAPFINSYAAGHHTATNYFAVAHPSLTNYLEVNGGSNFGVLDDNPPDWGNMSCMPNIVSLAYNYESVATPICPIAGSGTDAPTPPLDCSNEVSGPPCDINLDGVASFPANSSTLGITIADQLVAAGKSWKSYQESLPLGSPYGVDYADGNFSNLTDFTELPGFNNGEIVQLYAAKHDPFVYFQNIQQGTTAHLTLANVVDFNTLYHDLANGTGVPNYSFIAPNQCNDQHGRSNGTPFCAPDPNDNGTQTGLNPALIQLGDQAVQRLVTAIHRSPIWNQGHNAIIVVWDENDYSQSPINNQVLAVVDTNYSVHPSSKSNTFYTHFSLLKSIEGGFGLPCLNNACDASTSTMTDLFSAH